MAAINKVAAAIHTREADDTYAVPKAVEGGGEFNKYLSHEHNACA